LKVPETITGECACAHCKELFVGEITTYPWFDPPKVLRQTECPACKSERETEEEKTRQAQLAADRGQLIEKWRKTCGMPEYLMAKTFDTFDRSRQPSPFDDAEGWAREFSIDAPKGFPSLIFYSTNPGLGKTHLMVAIANYIFNNWKGSPSARRSPIIFSKGPGLVRRIRATYNLRDTDQVHEREEEVYKEVAGVPLLLLDDVGKETPSRFTRETYWYIIDERVTSGLPVIITSRLPLEGRDSLEELMGADTVDRLYGMTRGEVIQLTGQSYRADNRIP